jgi:very-short-patch-repair endonuclease
MKQLDVSSASARVLVGFRDEFEMVCFDIAQKHAEVAESEIELMLLTSFDLFGRLTCTRIIVGDDFPADKAKTDILITPQFKWSGYRIDMCLRHGASQDVMIFIECDGHDFHERTKEQAEHDRTKDRAIQAANIPILRFTGREIWRDPLQVAFEIFKFMCRR